MKREIKATALAVMIAVGIGSGASAQPLPGEGGHPCMEQDRGKGFDPLCPDPIQDGASCVAYGIVATERDASGVAGSAVVDESESRADARPSNNPIHVPRPFEVEGPLPPEKPQAHADAHLAGASYTSTFANLGLSAEGVYSRCDAATGEGMGHAYGRGGVARLTLTDSTGNLILEARALDYRESAFGLPDVTWAAAGCSLVGVFPGFSLCPPQNTSAGLGFVGVTLNEQLPPVMNSAGQWVYSGAAAHVTVIAGSVTSDIYIGYVAVAVTGGEPMSPIDFEHGPLG